MNEREIRVPVTRLKSYLSEVGITVSLLSEMSGIGQVHLYKCLSGEKDPRNGAMHTLSDDNLKRLQEALHQLSLKLRYLFIFYNEDKEVVRRNGNRYCPDCAAQIVEVLSPYFGIHPFLRYALGWTRCKVSNVIAIKGGPAYGNITQEDCNRINIVLAEVAARLDAITLTRG